MSHPLAASSDVTARATAAAFEALTFASLITIINTIRDIIIVIVHSSILILGIIWLVIVTFTIPCTVPRAAIICEKLMNCVLLTILLQLYWKDYNRILICKVIT